MANHRIEEVNSEYSASFLSVGGYDGRRNTRSGVDFSNRKSSNALVGSTAVAEVDEDEESEHSRKHGGKHRQSKSPKFGGVDLETPDAYNNARRLMATGHDNF
jgi:hypothetical protein